MTCTRFQLGTVRGIVCEPTIREHHDGRRTWRWEDGPATGPVLVDRQGEPLRRQPGPRSKFWDIWEAHRAREER